MTLPELAEVNALRMALIFAKDEGFNMVQALSYRAIQDIKL
jgi:hypothetical protein